MSEHKKKIEAVFLDRDGTIGGDDTIHYPGSFELYPYTQEIINHLKKQGIKILSFTNQPGIARGKATKQEFIDELLEFGFDEVFICPHSHTEGCKCRKPGTEMLMEGAKKHSLNLENCVVIGDRWSDMVAAAKVNCIKILVTTGAGQSSLTEHFEKIKNLNIEYVAKDLEDAIAWMGQHFEMNN